MSTHCTCVMYNLPTDGPLDYDSTGSTTSNFSSLSTPVPVPRRAHSAGVAFAGRKLLSDLDASSRHGSSHNSPILEGSTGRVAPPTPLLLENEPMRTETGVRKRPIASNTAATRFQAFKEQDHATM